MRSSGECLVIRVVVCVGGYLDPVDRYDFKRFGETYRESARRSCLLDFLLCCGPIVLIHIELAADCTVAVVKVLDACRNVPHFKRPTGVVVEGEWGRCTPASVAHANAIGCAAQETDDFFEVSPSERWGNLEGDDRCPQTLGRVRRAFRHL